MRHKAQISIVWALFLFFFGTVLVIDPNINVNVPVLFSFIEEVNFESSVSEPLDIDFALQFFLGKWSCLHFISHLHLSFHYSNLFCIWSGRTSWATWSTWTWLLFSTLFFPSSIQCSCEFVKFRHFILDC
jgi:hypothetical protein